jgi:choice-of-anchor B domain-containing protein
VALAVLAALGALAVLATAAGATDPPIGMEELTPVDRRPSFSASGMWGYADAGGEYALVTDSASLQVVDVTDPARPVVASRVQSVGRDLKEVKTYRHYAYCVNQTGPIQIVDLTDPYHAYTAATYHSPTIPGAHNIWCTDEGFAFVALQGAGGNDLRILDLADPLHPVERGSWRHPLQSGFNSCHDVFVEGDICYASWFGGGLVLLDVSDKDHPVPIVNINYPGQHTHNAWPTADRRFVATTDEMVGGHLRLWDLGGALPAQVAEYETRTAAIIHNVHVKGPLAYISYYTAGVRVVDLSNPLVPVEIGAFDTSEFYGNTFSGCWSVYPYTPSGVVYASDIQEGLFVLRFRDAQVGAARGTLRVEGAESATVAGAEIRFLEAGVRVVSDGAGYFSAHLYPGPHTARVRHFDFEPREFTITVPDRGVATERVLLVPRSGPLRLAGRPAAPVVLPDGRLAVTADLRPGSAPVLAATLHYRSGAGGSFRALAMGRVTADDEEYEALVPAQLPGTLLQTFITASDAAGNTIFYPEDAPATLSSHRVGEVEWTPVFVADFEADAAGFAAGGPEDWGLSGSWERAVPVPGPLDSVRFGGRLAQPTADATPGDGPGYCFLTEHGTPGANPGEHELSGRTTLTSPIVDLAGAEAARLRAAVWLVNDLGGSLWQDRLLIQGSSDGGATWRPLETIRVAAPGWQPITIDLGNRLALGAGIRVRFVIEDEVSPSFVEAAIDDVRIESTTGRTAPPGSGSAGVVLLRQNTPNPAAPATTITFQLLAPRAVRLQVYDAGGRLVRRLLDQVEPAGDHAVIWDGRGERGVAAPNGVYFYQLETEDFAESRKMLLMK